MTGEYMHTLDAKGRLAVPSRLRDELGGVFYVTLSMDRCLSAYSAESWQRFSDKVDAMPFVSSAKCVRSSPSPRAVRRTRRAASSCRRICGTMPVSRRT